MKRIIIGVLAVVLLITTVFAGTITEVFNASAIRTSFYTEDNKNVFGQDLPYLKTESGENICLKGKGYLNGRGGRGDLFVNVQIMIPKSITEKEKTIFEQLREISKYNPREIHS